MHMLRVCMSSVRMCTPGDNQVRNSRGLLVALDRAQYVAGLIATACGCTFGELEWSDSADPTYGSKNGHYTAAKMISLAVSEVVYFGAGAVAAVQVKRKKGAEGQTTVYCASLQPCQHLCYAMFHRLSLACV